MGDGERDAKGGASEDVSGEAETTRRGSQEGGGRDLKDSQLMVHLPNVGGVLV